LKLQVRLSPYSFSDVAVADDAASLLRRSSRRKKAAMPVTGNEGGNHESNFAK
jgi:hypothetical protein